MNKFIKKLKRLFLENFDLSATIILFFGSPLAFTDA